VGGADQCREEPTCAANNVDFGSAIGSDTGWKHPTTGQFDTSFESFSLAFIRLTASRTKFSIFVEQMASHLRIYKRWRRKKWTYPVKVLHKNAAFGE
jgi:hypothetical protein